MDGRGMYLIHAGFSPLRRFPHSLLVRFDPVAFARSPHPDADVEASISVRWEARLASNPALFNASKFRYAGCVIEPFPGRRGSNGSHGALIVHLGLTDYATFQGTHGVPHPLSTFGVDRLARPFGNAVVVETVDGFVPFLVRSTSTGEGAGAVVLPGGHPEPSEIGIGDYDRHESATNYVSDQDVCDELWNGARREVIEELFVPEERLSHVRDMRLLGVVSRQADEKALLAVWAALGMTADAVNASYQAGQSESDESVSICFVATTNLSQVLSAGELGGIRVMPDHLGTLALACDYYMWRKAESRCADAAQPARLYGRNPFDLDID